MPNICQVNYNISKKNDNNYSNNDLLILQKKKIFWKLIFQSKYFKKNLEKYSIDYQIFI